MSTQAKPDTNIVWANTGTIIEPTGAKKNVGWIQEKPAFENMNWVQNLYGEFVQHVNLEGVAVWDTATEYEIGALVKGSDDLVYYGLTATNQANDPTVSPANWRESVGVTEDHRLSLVNAATAPTAANPVLTEADRPTREYGGIFQYDVSTNINAPLGATWYLVTGWTGSTPSSANVTPSTGSSNITVGITGTYKIDYSVSFNAGAATANHKFGVQVNGDSAGAGIVMVDRAFITTVDTLDRHPGGSIIVDLTASDTVELWFKENTAATNENILVFNSTLMVTRVD